jgi:hypothetical protein
MAALTLNNFPDELLARLKERAAIHGRSVEAEAVDLIAQATRDENGRDENGSDPIQPTIDALTRFRASLNPRLTIDEQSLADAKRQGRP